MDDVPANSDISTRKSKTCLQAKKRQIIAWPQAEPEADVAFVDCGGGSNEDYTVPNIIVLAGLRSSASSRYAQHGRPQCGIRRPCGLRYAGTSGTLYRALSRG